MSDTGTYVYAVSRGLDQADLSGLTGVNGTPVRTVEHAGLTAIVSTVDLDDFGEEALRNNLEDLTWLENTARAHHGVADTAAGMSPVTPLRLATVYYSDERVRELLEDQGATFTRALDRITGRVEWGVKAYADPGSFGQPADKGSTGDSGDSGGSGGSGGSGEASPGAAYLRRRRTERQDRQDASRQVTERADAIHTTLRDHAAASRLHRTQDSSLSGHTGWMALNGAYLVDSERATEFTAVVHRLADEHPRIDLELTGPWAPYSFATLDEEER